MKKVAVLLCGSGYRDGSEIRESVAVLWALAKEKAEAFCFAPDEPQADVVNCFTNQTAPGESRNQLVEAARIARGKVRPLSELKAADFSAIVVPGGFGVAKNLCTFASAGSGGTVNAQAARVLREFHEQKKPIGAVCIAPALVGLVFAGKSKLELTLGARGEASAELEKLGHQHVVKAVHEWHNDRSHRVLSTPAYMYDDARLDELFAGVHGMIHELCRI